jgi:TRAP-type C4-dicarboxylate transport system substrate-binding protein
MGRALLTVAAPILVGLLVGCGGADKLTGVPPNAVETLTLANGNDSPIQLQPWLDEVRSLAKGRLRIRVLSRWREGQPGFETGLIADVQSGRVGLGWVGARAWSAQGVHGFDAFNAPFLLDSYGVERAALRVADEERLLAGLSAADVEPVAILPGPLRLLLTRRAVEDPAALRALRSASRPPRSASARCADSGPYPYQWPGARAWMGWTASRRDRAISPHMWGRGGT